MKKNPSDAQPFRGIPSVDEILRTEAALLLERDHGREAALRVARETVEELRQSGVPDLSRDRLLKIVETKLLVRHSEARSNRLQKVINATGVIIHTNLGRSPLSENTIRAITEASGYSNVELDLESGERGRRGGSAEMLAAAITGAEDAVVVNNCAAAALLVLSAIAKGGEVIVSRGELVEIGGDFRIPDVLVQSGCHLREVGTTNRTKLADYERAISAETKAILRVHPSNYRITGFTESASLSDLADLAHRNDLILFEDAGSGALIDLSPFGLADEPVIRTSIRSGADIVAFSGDKLAGGVQAGLIAGKRDLIKVIRKHPLYRAVRADKLVYAAVEATLGSFARNSALEEIPTLRMLSTTFEEIHRRATRLKARIEALGLGTINSEIVSGGSAVGGGAGTDLEIETSLIALRHSKLSAAEAAAGFRRSAVPVVARISDDPILLDLRTVREDEEPLVLDAIRKVYSD